MLPFHAQWETNASLLTEQRYHIHHRTFTLAMSRLTVQPTYYFFLLISQVKK